MSFSHFYQLIDPELPATGLSPFCGDKSRMHSGITQIFVGSRCIFRLKKNLFAIDPVPDMYRPEQPDRAKSLPGRVRMHHLQQRCVPPR